MARKWALLSKSFAGIRKLTGRDLETLRPVATHQGHNVPKHNVPTVAGVLLFGLERERRIDHLSYPPVAVREAVINAVVHADYPQHDAPLRIAIFTIDFRSEILD